MFSRDGSAAPLREYLEVLPPDALMLVDDAHAAGVLGRTGRGSLELAGVSRRRIIQTVTLSKAFGAYGGAILGTAILRRQIIERSRLFVGSTPLPLPLANAALQGVGLLRTGRSMRFRLARNSAYVKGALTDAGMSLPETPGPIVALSPKDRRTSFKIQQALLAAGIYPPFIQYPGGPAGGYFRFVICSEHSQEQLEQLVEVLRRLVRRKKD
jgi:7-keto-8-aminopelargonate synthetase-like enzyme